MSERDDYPRTMAAPQRRVTVRDIATEVGLHFTTVAEALRDSSRVKSVTKERVRAAAERLGYEVDPMLSALSAYRTMNRKPKFQGTLAWVNGFARPSFYGDAEGYYADCFAGAKARSKELGYSMESFWLAEPGMTPRRAAQILRSRNTSGVIVGPMPVEAPELDDLWEEFCSVRVGFSLESSQLSTVTSDPYGNTRFLYEKLVRCGYKRIGFVCSAVADARVSNMWSAAYFAMQQKHFAGQVLPPYIDPEHSGSAEPLLSWYRDNQPDVIICGGSIVFYEMLVDAGIRIPEDLPLVSVNADNLRGTLAGIRQKGEVVGAVTVDHVVASIHRFQVGMETHPKSVTIRGEWVDGSSFPADRACEAPPVENP